MKDENENRWSLIGRGFAGWHAKDDKGCSSSGGELMPYRWPYTGEECPGYLQEAKEGSFVYDASHLLDDDDAARLFEEWVICGPMANCAYPPGTAEGMGAFNFVALDVWIKEFLSRVPGVKHGYVRNGVIDWIESAR